MVSNFISSKMRDLELESDSNDVDDTSTDSDVCDCDEINRIFVGADSLCEKVVATDKYILQIDATSGNEPCIALALSDNSCEIHQLTNQQVTNLTTFTEHKNKIVDCRFSTTDRNLIYTGSYDGSIKLWDVRSPRKSVINFVDDTADEGKAKVFSCFDVSSNGRVLTAGTELFEGDAYLLFWDIRNRQLLGGYWESHTDDITQVAFHPEDRDKLLSASTDGLINIYDLSQTSEDDALIDSLNTQSSVDQLLWFDERGKDAISCITHTFDLQLWYVDGAEPYKNFSRGDIAQELKKKNEDYVYLEKVHKATDGLLVLAGSNFKDGECLRGLRLEGKNVQPAYGFNENKQRVRSSWFDPNTNILLTGGEKGILNVWNLKPNS